MKIKTADLTGAALDWMVGVALGYELNLYGVDPSIRARVPGLGVHAPWSPRRYWNQGGPIKTRERISTFIKHDGWWIACIYDLNDEDQHMMLAHDELIAAMRCLVASKLGGEVDVPEEVLK